MGTIHPLGRRCFGSGNSTALDSHKDPRKDLLPLPRAPPKDSVGVNPKPAGSLGERPAGGQPSAFGPHFPRAGIPPTRVPHGPGASCPPWPEARTPVHGTICHNTARRGSQEMGTLA